MSRSYRDLFVSAADGLRLYARDYGPENNRALPVVCLPGLARTSGDFHDLAEALSQDDLRPRRVLSLDYRGRGQSEWDEDWRNYDIKVELNDALQVLTAAGIEKAAFIGTSRGGLITMALSAVRPASIAAAVLNDVGPVLEAKGLTRIRSYVGKLPTPRNMQEASQFMRQVSGNQFPGYSDAQWEKMARGTWKESEGRLALNYDPNLARTLEGLNLEAPLPDLWPLLDGLKSCPVLVIRGANSDLLTAETVQGMQERHSRLSSITVPDQGHAPSLDGELIQMIRDFFTKAESSI